VTDERVERGMRRQLATAPPDRIGWKLALNAPALMEALGLSEPALGGLFRSRVADGSHSLAGAANPAVEPELLLEAAADGSLARVGVALEVVDFDRPLDDLEEVLAGGVFHRAVAFGPLVDVVSPGAAVFRVNEEDRASVSTFEPPADTLAFVARFLRELGVSLSEGDLVIAGALAPAAPVAAGDVASLDVTHVGSVSLSFTA
jgi:2-keto-4-pentenoate hydratase